MKYLFVSLLLSLSLAVTAQPSSSSALRTRIVNDDQTLSIQIEGINNGRKIHYRQAYDVAGMNLLQKEWLKYRAFESQGVALPLHEIAWLLLAALGLSVGVVAFLIWQSPAKQATRMNPVKSQPIE